MELNYILIPGIIVTFGGGSLGLGLLEISFELQKLLADKQIFSTGSHPKTIKEIYENDKWRLHFDAFYISTRNLRLKSIACFLFGLTLIVALVVLEGNAKTIGKIAIDHDVSLLAFLRGIHFVLVLIWISVVFWGWLVARSEKLALQTAV